jgi:hypothetical protein
MRALAVAVVLALLPLAAACADGGDARPEFKFTPYPYTVVPVPSASPILMAEAENGALFQADVVSALVFDVERFLRRAEAYGFTQYHHTIEVNDMTIVYIRVPPGAAPDAVKLLKNDRNVQSIELAYIYTIDD